MGAVKPKGTVLSQNRRRWQKWGTIPQRDPEFKDMQDCFVHFGAMCKGTTDHDRIGWGPLRAEVYKGTAEPPSDLGLGPMASMESELSSPPTPSFQRAQLEPTTQGLSQPRGAPGLEQPGSCLSRGMESRRCRAQTHTCTHRPVLQACPRGPPALIFVAQGLYVQPPGLFSTPPLDLMDQSRVSLAGPGKS